MTISKYRDVSEMPAVQKVTGEALASLIRKTWARARRLSRFKPIPGVQKFKSIQQAQKARLQELKSRIEKLACCKRADPLKGPSESKSAE